MAGILFLLALANTAGAQHFVGAGSQVTLFFTLETGVVVFEYRHDGQGPFQVELLHEETGSVAVLVDATGPVSGSRAVSIPLPGRHLFNVSGSGAWTLARRGEEAEAPPPDYLDEDALREVQEEALGVGTASWLAGGFGSGLLTGPLGTIIAVTAAGRSEVAADLGKRFTGPSRDAFAAEVQRRRQRSALIGGIVGTAVFTFAILQLLDFTGSGGGDGGEPGDGGPTF